MTDQNQEVIQAVFSATPEAKARALEVLKGKETLSPAPSRVPSGPQLIMMGKACELLGCSRTTLWRIIQAGSLQKVELFANSYRLRLDDVLSLIDNAVESSQNEVVVEGQQSKGALEKNDSMERV